MPSDKLTLDTVRSSAFSMPRHSNSYPPGPYQYVDREYLTVTYRTDPDKFRASLPEPLEMDEPLVSIEFVKMPDSTGFGEYAGAAQVMHCKFKGQAGGYTRLMFLDTHPPIAGGRELWGFPQKLANPSLKTETDTLVGVLNFGPVRVASGSMGFKHKPANMAEVKTKFSNPGFLLKIMPNVDGTPIICELVKVTKGNINIKGAWTGPVSLSIHPHALAPITDLPILEILGGVHMVADYTLELGTVIHDYLK